MNLSEGMLAPRFRAVDQNGQEHSLEDYRGKRVILYFYPKDDTPGCTTEACQFRDYYQKLQDKAVILGVSGDTQESHKKFATKYNLPFPLLVDEGKKIQKSYEANGIIFPKRTTYLIDEKGKIVKIYKNVKPEKHAEEILQDLEKL